MADFKKVLRAFLAKVTKKPIGDIDAILDASDATDDSIVDSLSEIDRSRVAELNKAKPGQTFQDGYKKAKAEVLTEHESKLKEKYDLETDVTGEELIDAIVTAHTTKTAGKKAELTDDDVRKHPFFQTTEKAHKKAIKDLEDGHTVKLTEVQKQVTRTQTMSTISSKALDVLNAMNPVFSANPTVAQNQKSTFLKVLDGYDYELQDNGQRVVVMKDGKVVDDGHGHSLEFDKLVKDNATNFFDFKANNGGANAGNGAATGAAAAGAAAGAAAAAAAGSVAYPAGVTKPKTMEELVAITNNTALKPAEREVVLKTWQAENPGQ